MDERRRVDKLLRRAGAELPGDGVEGIAGVKELSVQLLRATVLRVVRQHRGLAEPIVLQREYLSD